MAVNERAKISTMFLKLMTKWDTINMLRHCDEEQFFHAINELYVCYNDLSFAIYDKGSLSYRTPYVNVYVQSE